MINNKSVCRVTLLLAIAIIINIPLAVYALQEYNFVLKWGSFGSGNSQFMRPHDIAFDLKGNVYVSGRDNNNIQKFTHNGTFLMKMGI